MKGLYSSRTKKIAAETQANLLPASVDDFDRLDTERVKQIRQQFRTVKLYVTCLFYDVTPSMQHHSITRRYRGRLEAEEANWVESEYARALSTGLESGLPASRSTSRTAKEKETIK